MVLPMSVSLFVTVRRRPRSFGTRVQGWFGSARLRIGPKLAAAGQLRPQHFLYFLPEPQGHGSLRPTLFVGVGEDDGCVWKSCVGA
jgi:hypothetical protein